MLVCNVAREKCPKVADIFLNIDESNNGFQQKTVCKTLSVSATMSRCFCHGSDNKI